MNQKSEKQIREAFASITEEAKRRNPFKHITLRSVRIVTDATKWARLHKWRLWNSRGYCGGFSATVSVLAVDSVGIRGAHALRTPASERVKE